MGLTAHTDYSLRILVCLALQPETSTLVSQAAAANELSQHHSAKVSQTTSSWARNGPMGSYSDGVAKRLRALDGVD